MIREDLILNTETGTIYFFCGLLLSFKRLADMTQEMIKGFADMTHRI